jgi:hypothetical protein
VANFLELLVFFELTKTLATQFCVATQPSRAKRNRAGENAGPVYACATLIRTRRKPSRQGRAIPSNGDWGKAELREVIALDSSARLWPENDFSRWGVEEFFDASQG